MKQPTLTVKDIDGIIYRLLSTRMVEQEEDALETIRSVPRSALKVALETGEVEYTYLIYGIDRDTAIVDVTVDKSGFRFRLGCRTFIGVNAKKLLKWAKGK